MDRHALTGTRILVVDDNPPGRQLLQTLFRAAGAEVDEAANGLEALDMSQCGYDAILMDIQMPLMDGLEATRRVRELERTDPALRRNLIIGVTAHAMDEHRDLSLSAGMDAVITKPIDPETITSTIRMLISAR